ncbi:MAG: hypothetical protein ACLP0J_06555 [Solirubrobacteraceae bacterium]
MVDPGPHLVALVRAPLLSAGHREVGRGQLASHEVASFETSLT